jgi:hypothetical protein
MKSDMPYEVKTERKGDEKDEMEYDAENKWRR